MADDNKNPAGDTERTSILPQTGAQAADQTEVLPTHVSQAETAQMPPVTQQATSNAFAGTPLESVAGSSADDLSGDEAVAASTATLEPAPKKTSWGKRAAIAGAAAAILSVGFGAGIITHAAVMGMDRTITSRDTRTAPTIGVTGPRMRIPVAEVISRGPAVSRGPVMVSSRVQVVSRGRVMVSRGRAVSRAIPVAPARDLPRREAEAPAARMEARAVRTPPPRAKERPPAER